MLNAHALYQTQNPEKGTIPQNVTSKKIKPMTKNPERLTGRHFPALVPHNKVRRCIVCSQTKLQAKKRSESRYMCGKCNVGLCVQPCFEVYHTKQTF
ncbi:hypothetical protein NQ317_004758 [Molorchus minor]|uniref:PiggyBac transposable element-derived protein 4 C-terminal zinc-finger domain-containing protein n=1 Tax=Molorchus minor TaxID=1323400 RepID=A0ABQ9JEN8_9CUCU|nr:hypothetical protein NQ317_004758 [Molorchus minor]